MKVVITGTTGMLGRGVLLECLESPKVTNVLIVNRRTINHSHPKLKEVIVEDFFNLSSIKEDLSGYDVCYFCAGISSLGKSEEEFTRITYDLTINFANAFIEQNKDSVFCYVSGTGTDSTEKGRVMWARVKGRTENAILNMPFKDAYMFRPGYIQPLKGIKSRTNWYSLMYSVFGVIYLILRFFPGAATNTTNFGKAAINVIEKKPDKKILGNKEINELAKE